MDIDDPSGNYEMLEELGSMFCKLRRMLVANLNLRWQLWGCL